MTKREFKKIKRNFHADAKGLSDRMVEVCINIWDRTWFSSSYPHGLRNDTAVRAFALCSVAKKEKEVRDSLKAILS